MSTTTEDNLVHIHMTFDGAEDDRYEGGFAGENLWAIPMADVKDLYLVKSVPFFAYDVSYLDVVRAVDTGEGIEVQEVVGNGGLGLVRAMLWNGGLKEMVGAIKERFPAAHIEGGYNTLLTIAVAQSDVDALVSMLDADPSVNAVEVAKE